MTAAHACKYHGASSTNRSADCWRSTIKNSVESETTPSAAPMRGANFARHSGLLGRIVSAAGSITNNHTGVARRSANSPIGNHSSNEPPTIAPPRNANTSPAAQPTNSAAREESARFSIDGPDPAASTVLMTDREYGAWLDATTS